VAHPAATPSAPLTQSSNTKPVGVAKRLASPLPEATLTIATMPALIASGSSSQMATKVARAHFNQHAARTMKTTGPLPLSRPKGERLELVLAHLPTSQPFLRRRQTTPCDVP